MAQFNSYIDFLDLTAATDFCREQGTLCHYKKGERFVQQGTIVRYAALVVSGYFKRKPSEKYVLEVCGIK